jgi:broad specificity phosphatase PhoE
MQIILIRHGESEGNASGHINDDPRRVVNLTARGRAQAEAAAVRLREMNFVHAYVSQFARAQQTAQIILSQQSCALQIDARLNERRSGMDGLPVEAFNNLARADPVHYKPPHGESFLEQMERVRSFLDEAALRHAGQRVLAVSHENPIIAALALQEGAAQVVRRNLDNCGWIVLDWPA